MALSTDFKNMSVFKRMGLGFTASLSVAGVLFYFAKRNVALKRKADLDEYRAGLDQSATSSTEMQKDQSSSGTTNTGY